MAIDAKKILRQVAATFVGGSSLLPGASTAAANSGVIVNDYNAGSSNVRRSPMDTSATTHFEHGLSVTRNANDRLNFAVNPRSAAGISTEAFATQDDTTPKAPKKVVTEATTKSWGTGEYWPMAGDLNLPDGDPRRHLWANDGPAAKFDALLKARGLPQGALAYEQRAYFAHLMGGESGRKIPSGTLDETNAEKTLGVDLDGNGLIEEGIKFDFLDAAGNFGQDGKFESRLNVTWFGHCDPVGATNIMFEEPKNDVELNGVRFTAQDIKGLLVLAVESMYSELNWALDRFDAQPEVVHLKDGSTLSGRVSSGVRLRGPNQRTVEGDTVKASEITGDVVIRLLDGTEQTVPKNNVRFVTFEDRQDNAYLFHTLVPQWMKEQGRGLIFDIDDGDHVWNYATGKIEDTIFDEGLKPEWAHDDMMGRNGQMGDGKVTYVERTAHMVTGAQKHYRYWFEEKNGEVVNFGWNGSGPDFIWQPVGKSEFSGENVRNPFVRLDIVGELYKRSIAPPAPTPPVS